MVFLYSLAALPENKMLKTELKTFLLNKVWPVVFFIIWSPLIVMICMKLRQLISEENWEGLLDMMHIFLLAMNGLYLVFAVQQTSKLFKLCMDKVLANFLKCTRFNLRDLKLFLALKIIIINCFCFYIGGSIYYQEVLLPMWVPFTDNSKDYSEHVFYILWVCELAAGIYLVIVYGIVCPFVIVLTKLILMELDYLLKKLEQFNFKPEDKYDGTNLRTNISVFTNKMKNVNFKCTVGHDERFEKNNEITKNVNEYCLLEEDTKGLVKYVVQHNPR